MATFLSFAPLKAICPLLVVSSSEWGTRRPGPSAVPVAALERAGGKHMKRRHSVPAPAVLAVLLLGVLGCNLPQTRAQKEDESDAEPKYAVKTVGDVTDVGNGETITVGGVGLVVGLEGTGSPAQPGSYRTMLDDYLKKHQPLLAPLLKAYGVKNTRELLDSPDRGTSLVLVSAQIPPGARKNDLLDVEVRLPPDSKTTSLRGGRLVETVMVNYEYARNLSSRYAQSDQVLLGHPLAHASGLLLTGFGDGDGDDNLRQARIWGGGRSRIDRGFYLLLRSKYQYALMAKAVADRVNETFHGSVKTGPLGGEVAEAKNPSVVLINVPAQYRHNLPRYLRVVRLIPLRENLEPLRDNRLAREKAVPPRPAEARAAYHQQLADDLLNPARTVTTALRLEALGESSIPTLRTGLQSENMLVRFASAEALAYLGCSAAGEELARLVEQHPVLRLFSLTALASLDAPVSRVKLEGLLSSPNPETRYGAFRALCALDENEPAVQGELLNDAFWLHRVAPGSPGLVHVSSCRRAEIVLFGEEPLLVPPVAIKAGEFNVVAGDDDRHCIVSRFSPSQGRSQRKQCSLRLEDVLRTLAAMGGSYPEAVELVRQARYCQCVNARVEADQLPRLVAVQDLARAGVKDPDGLLLDQEVVEARPDFGATPTLFQRDVRQSLGDREAEEEAALGDREPHGEKKTAERGGGQSVE
jgi:hypothetical protein